MGGGKGREWNLCRLQVYLHVVLIMIIVVKLS